MSVTQADVGHFGRTFLSLAAAAVLALVAGPAAAFQEAAPATAAPPGVPAVNLNITPKRLTFDKATRSATVYIFNQGNAPATFDISLVDRVMLPSGEIKPATEAAEDPRHKPVADRLKSAARMILVSPRRAMLAPGKGQTIRLRITPPSGTDDPEYRTHLTVATVPDRQLGLSPEDAAAGSARQLSFRVSSVFGLSIPLIIRTGAPEVAGAIERVSLHRGTGNSPPAISVLLKRSGRNSLFGNLEVRSKGNVIGVARGIGVYTEIEAREFKLPLTRAPKKGESLQIAFIDDDSAPGRVIATSELAAP